MNHMVQGVCWLATSCSFDCSLEKQLAFDILFCELLCFEAIFKNNTGHVHTVRRWLGEKEGRYRYSLYVRVFLLFSFPVINVDHSYFLFHSVSGKLLCLTLNLPFSCNFLIQVHSLLFILLAQATALICSWAWTHGRRRSSFFVKRGPKISVKLERARVRGEPEYLIGALGSLELVQSTELWVWSWAEILHQTCSWGLAGLQWSAFFQKVLKYW